MIKKEVNKMDTKNPIIKMLIYPLSCAEIFLPFPIFITIFGAKMALYGLSRTTKNKNFRRLTEETLRAYIDLAKLIDKALEKINRIK